MDTTSDEPVKKNEGNVQLDLAKSAITKLHSGDDLEGFDALMDQLESLQNDHV